MESFLLEAQIVDFSVLELVNEQANKVGGGGGGKHVPDGGNTLTFLAAGLLGLVGVKMARKQGAARKHLRL